MENIKIIIKKDIDKELEQNWLKLQNNTECSVFQYVSWIKNWKKEISDADKNSVCLFVQIFYNEILICILPLQLISRFSFKTLKVAGRPFNDYSDIVLDKNYFDFMKQNSQFLFSMILSHISTDMVYFENVPEKSNLYYLIKNYELQPHTYGSYQLKYIKKNKLLSNKFENDTLRQIKRLKNLGELEFKIIKNSICKNNFFSFFKLNKEKQLQETKNWNYFKNNNYLNFLKNILFDDYHSEISVLYLNNKIIAGHFGLKIFERFYYLFPTYDKKLSKYSPGNILLFYLIKNFFENGGKTFDLTTGDEKYKIKISNNINKVLYFNKSYSIKGYILKLIIFFTNSLKKIKYNYLK